MFTDIQTLSAERVTEIREYIDLIDPLIPAAPTSTPRSLNTSKGLVFVQLYGLIEFTVLKTLQKAIFYINNENLKISEFKPIILSLVLNPNLDSLQAVNKKKWDKRFELFRKIEDNIYLEIDNALLPTNGENIQEPQLQSIWNIFCISDPIFHDIKFKSRITEIATNRINIAHGNVSAADVGSGVTINDLNNRLNEVSEFCSYFINVFENYIKSGQFKL